MNREEAIETLENGTWWDMLETMSCDYAESVKFHAALDMAIAALRAQQEPNDPLTLDELREMDGEPVYLLYDSSWAIVWVEEDSVFLRNIEGEKCLAKNWIGLWGNIYRRKPEGSA